MKVRDTLGLIFSTTTKPGFALLEDELQNIDMAEDEGDKKRHELKTKRQDYTGYDDEEFGADSTIGMKRAVLAKYDEDINGPTQTVRRIPSRSQLRSPIAYS